MIDGYKTGVGEANDNILTINSLKKDFEERIVAIENEIKALEKDTTTEKANLSDLIELRKTQELAVIELRGNQDKSSEELRSFEHEISRLETEKDVVIRDRNEKELNKRRSRLKLRKKKTGLRSLMK